MDTVKLFTSKVNRETHNKKPFQAPIKVIHCLVIGL